MRSGLSGRERLVAEAEAIHHAGAEILDDDVGGGDQALERGAALRALEIERDRALAGVLGEERDAHVALVELGIGAELAREIAGARHLDLDHVGAEHAS